MSEWTVKIIESVESLTLSKANPLGISDEIRKAFRMALIPHWRIRSRQRKSSELSQTPYSMPIHIDQQQGGMSGRIDRAPDLVDARRHASRCLVVHNANGLDGVPAILRPARRGFAFIIGETFAFLRT